ncbi:hypothetical protein E2562_034363 [Oryza meyeriana var. granulata]|uniref:Uncharacterized protein n=1 Tax=Oryza meyeriana var. granulata TaxID=110450 RepID=A0A6G1FFF7_9ORYZ|nr:hypothetical protein E2562_034363 [Oryza meyeriana var. granulata]
MTDEAGAAWSKASPLRREKEAPKLEEGGSSLKTMCPGTGRQPPSTPRRREGEQHRRLRLAAQPS